MQRQSKLQQITAKFGHLENLAQEWFAYERSLQSSMFIHTLIIRYFVAVDKCFSA